VLSACLRGGKLAIFESGAVVGQPESDSAGVAVLKKGGNAIDAAVTSACLGGILAPWANGFGGYGGWMLIHKDGETHCIDFHTKAPKAAGPKMYTIAGGDGRFGARVKDRENEIGYKAVSVPGTLAGLEMALEKFGTLSLADALAPAIKACDKGFKVTANYAQQIADHEQAIRKFPETAKLLLVGGELPKSGDKVTNAGLGKMLAQVAEKGAKEFYQGRIADRIVKYVQEGGGILAKEDLAEYEARLVDPVKAKFAGNEIYSAPLCSSGPSLIQMCKTAEHAELDLWARDSPRLSHGLIEIIRAAWMERYRHFGDPQTMSVPMDMILSDVSVGAAGMDIASHIAEGTRGQALLRPMSRGGTTHICASDSDRTLVTLTLTHGPAFGSFTTIPRMGLLLNSGMSRFDPGPGLKNSVGPGKSPIVNMAPAIMVADGKPLLAIGGSGGTRIPSSVFQVLARHFLLGEDFEWAMGAPRVHGEGNEWASIEEEFGDMAPDYLSKIGYELRDTAAAAMVRGIKIEDGKLLSLYDPRMKAKEKGL
jgi:gamma-glutamyltranspeptidase/glutathione hydrolase